MEDTSSVTKNAGGQTRKRNWKGQELETNEVVVANALVTATARANNQQTPAAVEDDSVRDDNESDDEEDSSIEEDDDRRAIRALTADYPVTPRQDGSIYRQNRKKSRAWNCFERGEYNKTAHRFTATCKYCSKKFDGRLPKLKSHIMECPEINLDIKAQCLKDTDDEETDEERVDGTISASRRESMMDDSIPQTPHSEKSRRGRPASKLWDCFIRGSYSKSAHRFSAVCKYCQSTIDGRKQKLKTHILSCSMIDDDTKDAYRSLTFDDGTPHKKPRLTDSSKSSHMKPAKKNYDGSSDDHHAALIYSVSATDPSFFSNDPHHYLVRFFIRFGIPLSALQDVNLQHLFRAINPNFSLISSKEEAGELLMRNFNILKQQEVTMTKDETFLTLAFHHEQDENTKFYHYYTNILLKNHRAFNVNTFSLENKNEIHLFADRWNQTIQLNGKAVAVICDSEENFKLAGDWISNLENFHHVSVLRCFSHVLVEFASSIFGHPYAIPVISDAILLMKNLRSLHQSSTSSTKTSKADQLLDQICASFHLVTRNRFLSLFLMIESIVKAENLIMEFKVQLRNQSGLSPVVNSSKFWTSIKVLHGLMKPFLEILYSLESGQYTASGESSSSASSSSASSTATLTLADTAAMWIYLTNQLEAHLSSIPEDYRQYIINIYNAKLLSNQLLTDLQKIAFFLHPRYTKGLLCHQETFFKSLLKFSCTFIRGYGYNELECTKLISQMCAYRNTSCAAEFPDHVDLDTFWQTMNQGKDFQTLQTLVSIILGIVPVIQGKGSAATLQMNGQLPQIHKYDSFYPELKEEVTNQQFLTMATAIRIHEVFCSPDVTTDYGHHHVSDLHEFNNEVLDRYELTNALELVYRRDLATLFKSTDLSNQESLMKSEGVNYTHQVFALADRFKREDAAGTIPSFHASDKVNTPNRKAENSNAGFDIDALIEMTYNS